MKVEELIKELEKLDPGTEIGISLRKNLRPIAMKPIEKEKISPVFDQDTNRLSFYAIDVNIYTDEE